MIFSDEYVQREMSQALPAAADRKQCNRAVIRRGPGTYGTRILIETKGVHL